MMKVTKEDVHTISEYIRTAHSSYLGPVFIDINRLVELHMAYSQLVVIDFLMKSRIRRTHQ